MTPEQYDALTDDEKRTKAAEHSGWVQCGRTMAGLGGWPPSCNPQPDCRVNNPGQWRELPDYLHDLNATHRLENILLNCGDEWGDYCDVVLDLIVKAAGYQAAEMFLHAHPDTRTKAFVLIRENS
jgi:hypothetical protein